MLCDDMVEDAFANVVLWTGRAVKATEALFGFCLLGGGCWFTNCHKVDMGIAGCLVLQNKVGSDRPLGHLLLELLFWIPTRVCLETCNDLVAFWILALLSVDDIVKLSFQWYQSVLAIPKACLHYNHLSSFSSLYMTHLLILSSPGRPAALQLWLTSLWRK